MTWHVSVFCFLSTNVAGGHKYFAISRSNISCFHGGDEDSEEVAEQEQLVTQGWRGKLLLQVRANHHVNHPINKEKQNKSKKQKQTNKQGEQAYFKYRSQQLTASCVNVNNGLCGVEF